VSLDLRLLNNAVDGDLDDIFACKGIVTQNLPCIRLEVFSQVEVLVSS
jgi:hypothetical protein